MSLVWTFLVRFGTPLVIQVENGPPLEHDGSVTVWKFVGTEEQAHALQVEIKGQKCSVERYCEQETPEQQAIRRQRREG